MMPGMGAGMDSRQLAGMMKKLGIDVQDVRGVQEVVVRTTDCDYMFRTASVSVMKAQGVETWQISGTPEVVARENKYAPSADDLRTVMDATKCDEAKARAALEATGGDLAEAILRLGA